MRRPLTAVIPSCSSNVKHPDPRRSAEDPNLTRLPGRWVDTIVVHSVTGRRLVTRTTKGGSEERPQPLTVALETHCHSRFA
jgi:hypothetical protein